MKPDQFTLDEAMVPVGDGHELYAQQWGASNPEQTIMYLHGGPGSGSSDKAKALFNPALDQVIFFDQRGCGNSTPYGSLEHNTTDELVEDINVVADRFDLETFTIAGGSWGSCLGLVYAIRHPERVERAVFHGIFNGRRREIDYIARGLVAKHHPEAWERYVATVPEQYKDNPGAYHYPRILGHDPVAAKESAYAYGNLEAAVIWLDATFEPEPFEEFDPTPVIIESHYTTNNCFLPDNYILDHAPELSMPVALVQGRYDMACPPSTAYELAKAIPDSDLIVTVAGHMRDEPESFKATKAYLAEGR